MYKQTYTCVKVINQKSHLKYNSLSYWLKINQSIINTYFGFTELQLNHDQHNWDFNIIIVIFYLLLFLYLPKPSSQDMMWHKVNF